MSKLFSTKPLDICREPARLKGERKARSLLASEIEATKHIYGTMVRLVKVLDTVTIKP